jgi:hypothetical protein
MRKLSLRAVTTLSAALVVFACVVAIAPRVAPAASKPDTQTIGAHLVVDSRTSMFNCSNCGPGGTPLLIPSCTFAIFVEFPKVVRATSYTVTVRDGSTTRTLNGPPFADSVPVGSEFTNQFYKAPSGSHRFELTAGGGPDCQNTDPAFGGRFEVKKAVASCPKTCGKVSSPPRPKLPVPPTGTSTARVQAVGAVDPTKRTRLTVIRDGKVYSATADSLFQTGDLIRTDGNTLLTIEFLIGGRVGVNTSTEVELVNERAVADKDIGVKRAILKNGSIWVKADAKTLKQPLEIQTNGGTMGIRG